MSTRQAAHQKRRRALGLCAYGGCPEKSGDAYHCPKHAAAAVIRDRHARQRAKVRRRVAQAAGASQ